MTSLIKIICSVLASFIVWTVYELGFVFNAQMAAAIAVFAAACLLMHKRGQLPVHIRHGLAVTGWSIALFLLYSLLIYSVLERFERLAAGSIMRQGSMGLTLIVVVMVALATIFSILLLLVWPAAAKYGSYAWYRLPLVCVLILRTKGHALIYSAQAALLLIWTALYVNQSLPYAPDFVAFLFILLAMRGMMFTSELPPLKKRDTHRRPSPARLIGMLPLVLILLFIITYAIFNNFAPDMMLGFAITAGVLAIAYVLHKLKWLRFVNVLLFVLVMFTFASLLTMLWTLQ